MKMDQADIASIRLSSQQLVETDFSTPKEIVYWMGAMQAQDYPMAKWAIGVRLPGATDQAIETAIAKAEIIRTHVLRPTWHFVAAEDVYWMLDLSAQAIIDGQRSRNQQLELTEEVYSKSNATIEEALSAGKHLTREELINVLHKAGIVTELDRSSHLFARAELEKIICSGVSRGSKITYALLAERVPKPPEISRDEALQKLARRFFTSRSPATLQDFSWWSGLPAREASKALEMIKPDFEWARMDGRTYWMALGTDLQRSKRKITHLLPTFDEMIISYSDRSASVPAELEHHMKEISNNGVFRPIIVIDGRVVGIWKRTLQSDGLRIEIQPFVDFDSATRERISQAASKFGAFLGKEVTVS